MTTSWNLQTVSGDTISAGCSACHGYPPLARGDPNAGQYADSSLQDYTSGGGAHGVNGHVPFGSVEGDAWGPCGKCHDNGASHNMDTGALNSTTWTNVTVAVDAAYNLGGTASYQTAAIGDTAAPPYKTCDNISCHYGLTPDWAMRAQVAPGTLTVTSPARCRRPATWGLG